LLLLIFIIKYAIISLYKYRSKRRIMTEQHQVAAANLAADTEARRLNLAVVESAQQIVDLTSDLRDKAGVPKTGEIIHSGLPPEYGLVYSVGDPELPAVVLRVAASESEQSGDMSSASAISWSVSAHLPKPGELRKPYHHKTADLTVSVTASASNEREPSTQVYQPWFSSLDERGQIDELSRIDSRESPSVSDFVARSHQSALAVMHQFADIGGYQVPEEATAESLRDAVDNPAGLTVARQWFDDRVAGPVRDRLALASALDLLDKAQTSDDTATIIHNSIQAQSQLTDPARSSSLILQQ
jgi:hypothetical protein